MQLEDDTLKLRAAEPTDLELLYTWENAPEFWTVSETLTPYSRFALEQYLQDAGKDIFEAKQLRLMIDLKNDDGSQTTIGTADLLNFDPHSKRAEIGLLIFAPQHRGQGYARKTMLLLKNYAFEHLLLHQLYVHIMTQQKPTITLFQSLGFDIAGIKKDWKASAKGWQDAAFMQCINK